MEILVVAYQEEGNQELGCHRFSGEDFSVFDGQGEVGEIQQKRISLDAILDDLSNDCGDVL